MKITTKKIEFKNRLDLECGQSLPGFELMVETYGRLNETKTNAILVCHAFSGNHHAAGEAAADKPAGWWDQLIGPNKAIDTNKYFVVSSNNIGGCSGSSGPTSINPSSGETYGADFPVVSVTDWVNSQKMLMDYFEIDCWEFVVGGSLGGMQALQWAISYPENVRKAGIFAAAAQASTQNIAMNEVARESIRKDENFHDGFYLKNETKPKKGLKTARMLGHITYLSEEHMDLRFGRKFQDIDTRVANDVDFQIENYLQYKGEKFSDAFDANTYILMTKAMDNYDPAYKTEGKLENALKSVKSKLLIVGFNTDWLFPPKKGKDIQLAAMRCGIESSFVVLDGENGHDSFLFLNDRYFNLIHSFLES